MKIRTLIVDDEPLARERIRTLLADELDLEIIGECANGHEAVGAIQRDKPDLLFLDVQMPELDGFGVLQRLGAEKLPAVIFVTAYDQYALRAFEVHALDYLLKPFDRERFQKALQRARLQIQQAKDGDLNQRLLALLENLQPERKWLERLVVKSGGRVFFLKAEEIDWIEAAGNYVRLHAGRESHLLRETIKNLETQLDPKKFLRLNRSTIVRIDRIKELQPWFNGEYAIILQDGSRLTSSRGYREKLDALLGKSV
ncbi:LytTR family DNA-binding domain-containing protein [candidate division KSB1 bacterium]|nr:LytTR family DNA-binding domain-containing protein [candidate division KSB1 bacterium]